MGGARGVDSMAQGRSSGGMTVNVSALDARSFMEYMGDRGGRSFYNAIRSGHGTLSSVFR